MKMNKLTKEQCLEAFNHILHCDRDTYSYISDAYRNDLSTLHTLINEHFDNPPLKFEELHKDMWVWDNRRKCFLKITKVEIDQWYRHFVYHYYDINMNGTTRTLFEENRFYRHEVKEVKENE